MTDLQTTTGETLTAFAAEYGFSFDDFQRAGCLHLESGSGVLVAAPTGAGKTVVGEFAVYLGLQQRRKCFYTTPIKALSNQKYLDLVRRHGSQRVGLLTGDSSINSEAPIVVMTTEVLRNMIYARSSTLDNLGYVVLDEVHYLADRYRGAVWEEVIIGLAASVQVVALSATVSNAEEFGEWLAAVRGQVDVVVSEQRPVPLYQHVLAGGKLYDLFAADESSAQAGPSAAATSQPGVNPALLKIAKQESRSVRDDARRPRGRSGKGKRSVGYGSGRYGGAVHRRNDQDRRGGRGQHDRHRRTDRNPESENADDEPRGAEDRRDPGRATGGSASPKADFRNDRGRDRDGGQRDRPPHDGQRAVRVPSRSQMVQALGRAQLLPAIVFIFSRAGCDGALRQLLGSDVWLTDESERDELAEIAQRHTAGLSRADRRALGYDRFSDALVRGIAAHHAGMLPALKECVEEAFVKGLVKIVFATETLALGINMPARSVVLEKLVKYNGESHADITPGEYTQLTGRAGRRGIDVEGHAVVVWQPGLDPRAVAGLASKRTYPLKSSFAPTYNMAVNLIGSVGRVRARSLLEQSFAQFQSDRAVVGLARQVERNNDEIARLENAAACDRGDFMEYARIQERIGQVESESAKRRSIDRSEEVLHVLQQLNRGDVIKVPAGRSAGWVVVINPGVQGRRTHPQPQVETAQGQVRRLGTNDFPSPPMVAGRMKIPKHFHAKDKSSVRNLRAALESKLASLDPDQLSTQPQQMDTGSQRRIAQLHTELEHHPCHDCPDETVHMRPAQQALRLESENDRARTKMQRRTSTIANQFDKICQVLTVFGYLSNNIEQGLGADGTDSADSGSRTAPSAKAPQPDEKSTAVTRPEASPSDDANLGNMVTAPGHSLARIYTELDLVSSECIRAGIFDELGVAQLAAVLSTLVYESRRTDHSRSRPQLPDAACAQAMEGVRKLRREVSLAERDARLDRSPEPDIGFAQAAFDWAAGRPLSDVLFSNGLTAGDFVRWVRQVIDFAGQVAEAAGPGQLRLTARRVAGAMRRGVVDFDPEQQDTRPDPYIADDR
jgi:ATP-dependent RNA helicase HelY